MNEPDLDRIEEALVAGVGRDIARRRHRSVIATAATTAVVIVGGLVAIVGTSDTNDLTPANSAASLPSVEPTTSSTVPDSIATPPPVDTDDDASESNSAESTTTAPVPTTTTEASTTLPTSTSTTVETSSTSDEPDAGDAGEAPTTTVPVATATTQPAITTPTPSTSPTSTPLPTTAPPTTTPVAPAVTTSPPVATNPVNCPSGPVQEFSVRRDPPELGTVITSWPGVTIEARTGTGAPTALESLRFGIGPAGGSSDAAIDFGDGVSDTLTMTFDTAQCAVLLSFRTLDAADADDEVVERGLWRAFDENGIEVASGTFDGGTVEVADDLVQVISSTPLTSITVQAADNGGGAGSANSDFGLGGVTFSSP